MTDTAKPSLTIISETIAARLPHPTNDNPCLQSFYGASMFWWNGRLFAIGHGGYLDHQDGADDAQFVDKGYIFEVDEATLQGTFISRASHQGTFPWCEPGLTPDEDWISSVASPRVFTMPANGRRMFCVFSAFAADPHKATGVHRLHPPAEDGGSLIRPWSRGRIYLTELLHDGPGASAFELYAPAERSTSAPQGQSFAEAYAYHEPPAAELERYMHDAETGVRVSNYQGAVGVHSALWIDGRLYTWLEFRRDAGWDGQGGQTQLLVRTAFAPFVQEVWDGQKWAAFADRAQPQWVNSADQITGTNPDGSKQHWPKGNIYGTIASSIDEQHVFGGSKLILTSSPDGSYAAFDLSEDTGEPLTRWKGSDHVNTRIASEVPGTTYGQPDSCKGTCYFEIDGKPHIGYWRRPAQCTSDAFAGLEFVIAQLRADNAPPVVIVPPVDPGPPPAPTLPYNYTVAHPLPVDEAKLTVANGYVKDRDAWYVSATVWAIFQGAPLFPNAPDGGLWVFGGKVTK